MRTTALYQALFGLTLFVGPVLVSIASFAAYVGACPNSFRWNSGFTH
jgi:hypothetical protein